MAELITVARPYAVAIFRLAKETGTLPLWSDVLAQLALIAGNELALEVVANPKFSVAQVKELLLGLLGGQQSAEVQNFIDAVLENRRFTVLPAVAELFEEYKAADAGEVEARIESAFALTDSQVAELSATLSQQLHRKVTAQVSVNPELIGGVKVTVGDLVVDASVRGKLTALASSLKS
ncbi:F0F1 ATP synthase subunit delta [Iodobacter fluviatilis]|uniref:ATP synthase subunit delta n=1 Tax=Iodobacter fluviatilis TaxID=537 RepID=A0A377SV41_9NEIS|nr:F0F1 ATP synthase subunit delta [Iodobacter fluviatilis]TCU82049.1 ATP synthase F1 subcomplex delta subunit [Iodobacter fluviatilis]STR44857.1 F-type ATPase subunit delta [Iodobacter fluviatilis]